MRDRSASDSPARIAFVIRRGIVRRAARAGTTVQWYGENSRPQDSAYVVELGEYAASRIEHRRGLPDPGNASVGEGYFSIFKRGMKGAYQHCGKQHLHRYLSEFDFRYNNPIVLGVNDSMRTDAALKGISGKRLTYRRIGTTQAY